MGELSWSGFLEAWGRSAHTSLGFFWMALWAFCLGYLVSSMIQVFVSSTRIQRAMGSDGPRAVGLGTLFGFLSSSCSFAALATTRTLFAKGAGLAPALAFLLASTNLVIELGIVIAVFLSWPFVVGEYVGGILLIAIVWALVRLFEPTELVREVRASLDEDASDGEVPDWKELIRSLRGWTQVGQRFVAEWRMVWKDVTIGFAVAGAIQVMVPAAFFEWLFVGTGGSADPSLLDIVLHAVVGPLAAAFTFIGSMGNIPLAAVLYDNGVSFAGVMAFIFSDLVVVPVLRIQARYYGWRLAAWIAGAFLIALVITSVSLHLLADGLGVLPEPGGVLSGRTFFAVDHTLVLNLIFVLLSAVVLWIGFGPPSRRADSDGDDGGDDGGDDHDHGGADPFEVALTIVAGLAIAWVGVGETLFLLGLT